MHRKIGYIAYFSAALALVAPAASAATSETFYSPVELSLLRRNPSITISNAIDHMEITYRPRCNRQICVSRVVEMRWEDGSDFQVFDGERRIFRLKEADPNWAYRYEDDVSLFFVGYPTPGEEKLKYRELRYSYTLLTRSPTGTKQYNCTFDFSRLKGIASARLGSRTVQVFKNNPIPSLISKFLSEHGADMDRDKCGVQPLSN